MAVAIRFNGRRRNGSSRSLRAWYATRRRATAGCIKYRAAYHATLLLERGSNQLIFAIQLAKGGRLRFSILRSAGRLFF